MKLYSSQYFNISISTTKVLFKITNNKTNKIIKIDTRKLVKAYNLKDTRLNNQTVLNMTLYLLNHNLDDLKQDIKEDKKRTEALKYIKSKAIEIKEEFIPNYSYLCLFKQVLNL